MSEYYDMIASGRKDKTEEQKLIEEAQKQNREAYATGNYNTWMSQLERGVPVGIEEGYNANMRNKGMDNVWGAIEELPAISMREKPYTHHDNAVISASPPSYIPPTHKNRHPWDTDMVTNYELNRAKFKKGFRNFMSANPDMVPQEVKGFNDNNRLFNGLGMFDATKWMIPIARWWENR